MRVPRLTLASASPRRRELLVQAGFTFDIEATDTDETALPGEDAVALALRLARRKAEAVPLTEDASAAESPRPGGRVVLAADTVVAAPTGELLGKPRDEADAGRMLRLLGGGTHQVVTGVYVRTHGGRQAAAALTYVTFLTLSDTEIAAYIATGEPWGKAGAYAIQGRAARWIPRIAGEYSNVVGLPLALVTDMLSAFSIAPA